MTPLCNSVSDSLKSALSFCRSYVLAIIALPFWTLKKHLLAPPSFSPGIVLYFDVSVDKDSMLQTFNCGFQTQFTIDKDARLGQSKLHFTYPYLPS